MALVGRGIGIRYIKKNIGLFNPIEEREIIILRLVINFYSHIPILVLTDDNNYGTIDIKSDRCKNLRFSLIQICLGNQKLYFFTWSIKDIKFNLIYILKLDDIYIKESLEEELEHKANTYLQQHLKKISNRARSDEKEFILYKLESEHKRIDTSKAKINLYTTILLAILPLIIIFFDINLIITINNGLMILLLLILFYSIFNISLYVYQANKVKGIGVSSFSEVKNIGSNKKSNKIIHSYYFDWQVFQRQADLIVSYVRNIERWIVVGILSAALLGLGINIGQISKSNFRPIIQTEQAITIDMSNLTDIYSEENIQLSLLHYKIRTRNINELIIICNREKKSSQLLDNMMIEFVEYGTHLNVRYIQDDKLKDQNIIKIIPGRSRE